MFKVAESPKGSERDGKMAIGGRSRSRIVRYDGAAGMADVTIREISQRGELKLKSSTILLLNYNTATSYINVNRQFKLWKG